MTPEEIKLKFEANKGQVGGAEVNGKITQNGTDPISSPITSATITPETPITLPETKPETAAVALSGVAGAMKDTQKQLEEQTRKAEEAKTQSKDDLTSIRDEILGVQGNRPVEEEKAGLAEKAKQLAQVANQIEASQRAQVNELRALDSANMSDAGRAAATRDINRKYAFEQADLALIQSAANRDYATAQSIVDRKIELQLEPLKTKLEFTKLFYEDNKQAFDKADDRAFQNLIKTQERELNKEETKRKDLADLQLQLAKAGAPIDVIKRVEMAESYGDAVSYASKYLAPSQSGKTEIVELNGKKVLINSQTGDIITDFGDYQGDVGVPSAYQMERRGRIVTSVDELLKRANFRTVGVPSVLRVLPGSIQRDFKADLETLKANISFSELQAMREASKTGGALGQVAIRELELLESTLGALDQGQSPDNFRKNLDKVKESIGRWYEAVVTNVNSTYTPGTIVEVDGKQYKVGADGDTLEEI